MEHLQVNAEVTNGFYVTVRGCRTHPREWNSSFPFQLHRAAHTHNNQFLHRDLEKLKLCR